MKRRMFVYKAGIVHTVPYDYSRVPGVLGPKVTIVCPEHGEFTEATKLYLQGKGCPSCRRKVKLDEFIAAARSIHGDKYGYDRAGDLPPPKVIITCGTHGDFTQSKYSHLKGSGCPLCNPPFYRQSRVANKWLDSIGLPNDNKHREVRDLIPGKRITVGGFDPSTNTVYEFYGDAYHGNPSLYPPETVSHLTHKTYGQLNQQRLDRENSIKEAGFKLVIMWESEFKNPLGIPPRSKPIRTPSSPRHNAVLNLTNAQESSRLLQLLYDSSKGKGEGRIKCTISKHRIAKTAILLGVLLLSRRDSPTALELIQNSAPKERPGRKPRVARAHKKITPRVKVELVLECASTKGLVEGVDRVWRLINGAVSHRRVTMACLAIGLGSLSKVDPGKMRQLVSKVCPVSTKYFDYELGQWL
jgi:hypothetical protein